MNVSNRGCIRRLSLRALLASRTRNTVAVLAIALTAVLFTSLFTIALSINEGIQQNNFRQAGGWNHGTFKYLTEEQFEEMKLKLGVKENSELYRLGNTGGFYRKVDSELIHGTFKRHMEERRKAIFTESGINAKYVQSMFYYEMCNHEFGINWDGKADVLCLFCTL